MIFPLNILQRHWHRTVPRYLGALAKRRGYVAIGNCRFLVDSPEISAHLAGVMVQGNYEGAEVEAIQRFVPRDLPIIECGAAMGITSCVANRLLARPADHIVIEPNPLALRLLERNRSANRAHFSIVPAAIGYGAPTITFTPGDELLTARAGDGPSAITVSATRLRDHARWERFTLLCDIEGAELDLFANDGDLIHERVGTLLLETHHTGRGNSADTIFPWLTNAGFHHLWNHGSVSVWGRANN